jgi:hypothetical protein
LTTTPQSRPRWRAVWTREIRGRVAYLIYNSDLAEVASQGRRSGEDGVVYVDDNTMIATVPDYNTTYGKLADMTGRAVGVDE